MAAKRTRARTLRRAGGAAAAAPRPSRRPLRWRALVPRLSPLAWAAVTLAFLVVTAVGVERRITWYLAVDQFGYLTFANDLLAGRLFHDWPLGRIFASRIPLKVDIQVQTFIWDQGRAYSRYAPGFPIILAGWMGLFGRHGAHYLNPTVFLLLLSLALAFAWRVLRSRWRATAVAALIVLCPTYIHLWSLTLVRDLAAHLVGILGLFLVLPAHGRPLRWRRAAGAAVALGYAASIRPDAIMYCVPALAVAGWRWRRERAPLAVWGRALGGAAAGLVLGLAPLLFFNWLASGNPFVPTQAMELTEFIPSQPAVAPRVGYPPGAWRGGTTSLVQGGGLSIRNLPRTLPGIVEMLRDAYGDGLLALALLGAVLAGVRRRVLFCATVPYVVLAVLFFSCWTRPDSRYLSGVWVLLPMLIVEGVLGPLDLAHRLGLRGRERAARAVALGAACIFLLVAALGATPAVREGLAGALPVLAVLVPALGAGGALAASAWPGRRVAALAAPALGLALATYGIGRGMTSMPTRASFQRPQMEHARATFAAAVRPPAAVVTTEEVGRPMENIEWYSGVAHAIYFTDLARWRLSLPDAAELLSRHAVTPYLLIRSTEPGRAQMLEALQQRFAVELVADIPAQRAIEYFVAAPFHRGMHMELYRLDRLQNP